MANEKQQSKSGLPAVRVKQLNLWYGDFQALYDVGLEIGEGRITALIGPSGCGKSTLLRAVNRIIQRLPYVRIKGSIEVFGKDVYAPQNEVVQVRRQIGMVFQRPNPLPLSIRDTHGRQEPRRIGRHRPVSAAEGSAVGRSEGPLECAGAQPIAGSSAKAVHRPPVAGQTTAALDG